MTDHPTDPPANIPAAPFPDPSPEARLVARLSTAAPTAFALHPDEAMRARIAQALGFDAVRKLRFEGEIAAQGRRDWRLEGQLGATIVQACVVTLDPVATRIDVPVARHYVRAWDAPLEAGAETEMPEDVSREALGTHIDPFAVLLEALALEAPDFPRADGVAPLGDLVVTEPGRAPLTDADVKPFAGLAALRETLSGATPEEAGGDEDSSEGGGSER